MLTEKKDFDCECFSRSRFSLDFFSHFDPARVGNGKHLKGQTSTTAFPVTSSSSQLQDDDNVVCG